MLLTSYDIKKVIISTLALLVGTGLLQRSLSQTLSREDKTDELDERNQYISLKAKAKSLQVTQIISWILMLILLVIGGVNNDTLLITFGMGIMIPFMISLFGELFCVVYYDR